MNKENPEDPPIEEHQETEIPGPSLTQKSLETEPSAASGEMVSSEDTGGADSTVPSEQEEILFPMEPENRPKAPGPLRRQVWGIGWVLLLILVFFAGYGTQPEVMQDWMEDAKHWLNVGVEKAKPLADEAYEKTIAMVDQIHGGFEAPNRPMTTPENEATPGKKIKYWRAPMNPDYTSDKPGKGPMGMDLVPVYEEEDNGGVSINPAIVQNIGVKTTIAKKQSMSREIRTVGNLTYDERLEHHIHTKYGGWIEKLYVDFTGQEVKRGDVLMEIYSPELVSTQEELLLALKYKDSMETSMFPEFKRAAGRLLDSTIRRLELFDIPEHQIQELISTRKVKKTMHIHSPMQGVVVKKNAQHGMRVVPGQMLYLIANLSNIWVLADVYEYELPFIELGQKAEMELSYFPGKVLDGGITYIDPTVNPQTRTVKVRLEFPNKDGLLKPNMYANVTLRKQLPEKEIVIPEEAVLHSGERNMVIIQAPSGRFDSREVILGVTSQGMVQVLKGIDDGERVITSSTFLIDSESRLKEALNKLTSSPKEGKKEIVLKEVSDSKKETKVKNKP